MAAKRPIVFLAFANDRERRARYLRNLPEEARRLRAVLAGAEHAGLCELVVRQNLTVEELFAVFQGAEYRDRIALFHYGGHANGYALLLEGTDGGQEAAHAAGLAQLLGEQRGLRLVFLNGCATEPQAQGLTDAGVAAVLVTSQAIDDQVALEFAGHFYAGLGGGASIETAYAEAKAAVATCRGSGVLREGALDLYRRDVQTLPERWPWQLHLKDGATGATAWSLPEAAGDLLFGLPPLPRADLPERPYRHLQRFERAHAELFFGRGREIRALYERITDPHAAPILLLYGRSGVGKSSLLEAGLIPRLEQTHQILCRCRKRELGLWGTLAEALEAEDATANEVRDRWYQQEQQSGRPLAVVLDQVEEVYTQTDPQQSGELNDFLDALEQLLGDPAHRPNGKLVLGLRQEWLPELEQGFSERELPRSAFYLQSLDRAGLIEAIAGPARTERLQQRYGLDIEDGLPEGIADTLLADPEAPLAPTLQVLLDRLWDAAKQRDPAEPHLDGDLYQGLKRDGILLANYLDQQLTAIEDKYPETVHSGLVLDLLAYHTTGRGTAEAHSAEALQREYVHQRDRLPDLIEACQKGYLLLPTEQGGTRLSHDTLAPLIRERFEESDRPGQRARTILEGRVVEWADGQQDHPLDGTDLGIVEAGKGGMREWTAPEQSLIEASRRERDRRARRRRMYSTLGIVAVIAVVLSAAFSARQWRLADQRGEEARVAQVVAENQRAAAEEARKIAQEREREAKNAEATAKKEKRLAQSRQLAAQANLALTTPPTDLVLGTLLATEALKREQTLEAYRAWSKAMTLLPREVRRFDLHKDEEVSSLALSPDGRRLAATVVQGSVEPARGEALIWDAAGGSELGKITHAGWVSAVAFNPSGARLATASWDRTVAMREAATGAEQYVVEHDQPVWSLDFSPDGKRFAAGGRDGTVWVRRVSDGVLLHQLQHDDGVDRVLFSPSGNVLAAGSRVGTVRLWDPKNGQALQHLRLGSKVDMLAFSPDGRFLAAAGSDGKKALLWDVDSGQEHLGIMHDANISEIAFSPDGGRLLTASYDRTARLWDVRSGEELARFTHKEAVWGARFSPDGRHLATMPGPEGKVALWDLQKPQKPVREFRHADTVGRMAFSPDGRRLVTAGGNSVYFSRLWDVASGEELALLPHDDFVSQILFSPDGQRLATTTLTGGGRHYSWGEVRVWDSVSGAELQRLEAGPRWLGGVAYSPDGARFAVNGADSVAKVLDAETGAELSRLPHWGSRLVFVDEGRRVWWREKRKMGETIAHLWDLEKGMQLSSLRLGDTGDVLRMAVTALTDDRARAVTSGTDGYIRVWDTSTGERILQYSHRGHRPGFSLSGDGKRLAWREGDAVEHGERTLQVRDLENDRLIARLRHNARVLGYRLSPDGRRLATVVADKDQIWLWDTDAAELVAKLKVPVADLNSVSLHFSPDSSLLLAVPGVPSDGTLLVWDTATGEPVSRFRHECDGAGHVHVDGFSSDGRELYTSSICSEDAAEQSIARIWDLSTGTELRRLRFGKASTHLHFSPDGTHVAFADWERETVHLWDTVNGELISELAHHGTNMHKLAFSTDGRRLAGASTSGSIVMVWDLPSGNTIARLQHAEPVSHIAFLSDADTLLTVDKAGVVSIWYLEEGREEKFRLALPAEFSRFAMASEAGRVATVSGRLTQVWDVERRRKLIDFRSEFGVGPIALSTDGRRLVTALGTEEAFGTPITKVWDVDTGDELLRLSQDDSVEAVAFGVDDTRLVTGSKDGTARVWDADTGRELVRLSHECPVVSVFLSPKGRRLAAVTDRSCTKQIHVWDVGIRRRLAQLPHDGNDVSELVFGPRGEWLATASKSTPLRLWRPSSARPERLALSHEGVVRQFILNPNGQLVYVFHSGGTLGEEGKLGAYDLTSGSSRFEISMDYNGRIELSPDGGRLATMRESGVGIWDARKGDHLLSIEDCNRYFCDVAFSSDGRHLAIAARGDILRLWDLEARQEIEIANAIVVSDAAFSPDGRHL